MGTRVARKILPPYEPMMKIFLLMEDWHMVNPLTGITTFYFFLNIRNPFNGYFIMVFIFVYSTKAWFWTSQSKILPSEPKDRML
jgi:hypothetical protein